MKQILFVKGFNTSKKDYDGHNIYVYFDVFFKLSNYKLDYFEYDNDEDLNTVYERLRAELETKKTSVKLRSQTKYKYDVVMAHSMGGCLMTKYIHEHPDFDRKLILLAPFLCKDPYIKFILRVPLIQYGYLPKAVMTPNSKLFKTGNLWNDSYKWIPLKQIKTAYQFMIHDQDELTNLLNNHNNCHIIYNEDEKVTVIPQETLNKFERRTIIGGKHTCFLEVEHSEKLFDVIMKLLRNDA
jgi:pimeloyl-ACP methyl ester carboxylesterase